VPGAEQSIIVNVPVEVLFSVIVDYERYPEFLKDCAGVRVLDREDSMVTVEYTLDLIKKVTYVICLTENEPTGVSWTLVRSNLMKSNEGGWELIDRGDGTTKAIYRLDVGVGRFVPRSIVDRLTKTTLPATLKAFKQRAEQHHG